MRLRAQFGFRAYLLALGLTAVSVFTGEVHAEPFAYVSIIGHLNPDNTLPPGLVSVIDTATNTVVGAPIEVDPSPLGIAVTPDGRRVYVQAAGAVWVIDTTTNTSIGSPIRTSGGSGRIAIAPDGRRAYATTQDDNGSIIVIDTLADVEVGPRIAVPGGPTFGIAITRDGRQIYVTHETMEGTVSVVDTASNTVMDSPISVGSFPSDVVLAPDDARAYVAAADGSVSIIDTATKSVVESPDIRVEMARGPSAAISRDGTRLYVGAGWLYSPIPVGRVSVFDIASGLEITPPITVGLEPSSIAFTPDGTRAYVTNSEENTVSVIDTATNSTVGSPIVVAAVHPFAVAIAPPVPTPNPTATPSPTEESRAGSGGGCTLAAGTQGSGSGLFVLNLLAASSVRFLARRRRLL
jgi:YVTN family beta-propeller protein